MSYRQRQEQAGMPCLILQTDLTTYLLSYRLGKTSTPVRASQANTKIRAHRGAMEATAKSSVASCRVDVSLGFNHRLIIESDCGQQLSAGLRRKWQC
jgi:hypothetical protein